MGPGEALKGMARSTSLSAACKAGLYIACGIRQPLAYSTGGPLSWSVILLVSAGQVRWTAASCSALWQPSSGGTLGPPGHSRGLRTEAPLALPACIPTRPAWACCGCAELAQKLTSWELGLTHILGILFAVHPAGIKAFAPQSPQLPAHQGTAPALLPSEAMASTPLPETCRCP